jgi:hypothetical protein
MKLMINDVMVDVTFNPAGAINGRPDAGMSYTASLRADSTDGSAKLTVGTDFTPPAVLAVLPEWSTDLASDTLAELGLWAPAKTEGWLVARDGVYAYADGVRYGEAVSEELAFMASFGFTPGARFNLALPMLRAQRADWFTRLRNEAGTLEDWHALAERLEKADKVNPISAPEPLSAAQEQGRRAAQEAADNGTAGEAELSALAAGDSKPEVVRGYPKPNDLPPREESVAQLNRDSNAAVGPPSPSAPKRRRRTTAKPAGKVEVISQALGEPTEESLVSDAAIADVFDVLDATPALTPAAPVDDEANPFAIEGL